MHDIRCKNCGAAASADGSPIMLVNLVDGEPVYACTEHAADLAAPPGDLAVALAQLMDVFRRFYDA
ncbi:hypothetical protein [Streptomyces sp. NPDC057854]|uniref:hypothetical protein n=1 Tax=unclassified Streptomyces TaxID=2593676 RepID=UPI003675B538